MAGDHHSQIAIAEKLDAYQRTGIQEDLKFIVADQSYCRNFHEMIPNRLSIIVDGNGYPTKY